MSWSEALKYAAGPGVNLIVGVLLSYAVEYWPAFGTWEPKWKRLVTLALSLAVPVVATALAVLSNEWGAWGDWATTWWPALVAGGVAFGAATFAHIRKLA